MSVDALRLVLEKAAPENHEVIQAAIRDYEAAKAKEQPEERGAENGTVAQEIGVERTGRNGESIAYAESDRTAARTGQPVQESMVNNLESLYLTGEAIGMYKERRKHTTNSGILLDIDEQINGLSEVYRKIKASLIARPKRESSFQNRVKPWMDACFGPEISNDKTERNHRFIEEALELVQACGASREDCHMLVDYVYGRPVGEQYQESGGVMVTHAALCLANGLDMHKNGETELERIWGKVEVIREKQRNKPRNSPLPEDQGRRG